MEGEGGASTVDFCRRHDIGQDAVYWWKAMCGGLEVREARRLKSLGDENRRFSRIVADHVLGK